MTLMVTTSSTSLHGSPDGLSDGVSKTGHATPGPDSQISPNW